MAENPNFGADRPGSVTVDKHRKLGYSNVHMWKNNTVKKKTRALKNLFTCCIATPDLRF